MYFTFWCLRKNDDGSYNMSKYIEIYDQFSVIYR